MKKMIQDKNAKIEELRKRLGKYEGKLWEMMMMN
jgi:hypothetical protein